MDTPFSLPTPPTLEQRLDAAAEAYRRSTLCMVDPSPIWRELHAELQEMYRKNITEVCRAFAPEHFKEER